MRAIVENADSNGVIIFKLFHLEEKLLKKLIYKFSIITMVQKFLVESFQKNSINIVNEDSIRGFKL